MTSISKLKEKLMARPKDFSYAESKRLLSSIGFNEVRTGKTSGSRVKFKNDKDEFFVMHRPHPDDNLKLYVIDELIKLVKRHEK